MKAGDEVRVLHLTDAGTCLVPATVVGHGRTDETVRVRLDDGTVKDTLTVYVSAQPEPGSHVDTVRTCGIHGQFTGSAQGYRCVECDLDRLRPPNAEDVRRADVTFRETLEAFGPASNATRNALDRCARWRGYPAPMHAGETR